MTKQIAGVPPRYGKSIRIHLCPDCHTQLNQINETTFCCPVCKHKVKALVLDYSPKPNMAPIVGAPAMAKMHLTKEDERERELKEWFKQKVNERIFNGYGRRKH